MNPPRRDVLIWEAFDPEKGEWYTIATMAEMPGDPSRIVSIPLVLRDKELAVASKLIAQQHGITNRHEVRLMRYAPMKTMEVIEPPAYVES